jgi:CRISPR system Cascade subunit CasD
MEMLMLRFDAPLMSFGGVMVDQHGPTDRFPGLAMLTGLLGNALGWRHSDFARLQSLQSRVQFSARWDVEPDQLRDYHTVDLGQPKMCKPGWTTRGTTEHRAGGAGAKFGTHQRYRHYWANGIMTLALSLEGDADPTLGDLETALRFPARPLFIGRKTCLPAAPILLERVEETDLLQAISNYPSHPRCKAAGDQSMSACWPSGLSGAPHGRSVLRYDQREWRNQIHTGRREHQEGVIGRPSR